MSNQTKIIYYDLETSGLDFKKNCVLSLHMEILGSTNANKSITLEFSPHERAIVDEKALAVNKLHSADIALYPPWKQSFKELITWLNLHVNRFDKHDKATLIGFNNRRFDDEFLRMLWTLAEDKFYGAYFWSNTMDVSVLATEILMHRRYRLFNFKLPTVAIELGINVDSDMVHDPAYDVWLTKQCHLKLQAYIPSIPL
jgi:DNA polymerase-3 subunit epsilon